MINKPIDQITEQDLQTLVNNKVTESKTTEYKQTIPGNSDADKKEFLADISSFANAIGGDLIYGITENPETREPQAVQGLNITNLDETKSRLENILRDGISPRIIGVSIKEIILKEANKALVIRIPKSWNSPHRVVYEGHDKFYARSSNGKYPMDVGELRAAFMLSETTTERIRNFRIDRVAKILADDTPVPLMKNAKIVLHLVPISSFSPAQRYNIETIVSGNIRLKPIYCNGWNERYNLDGRLSFTRIENNETYSYVQLYRNGIIEAVESSLLEPHENSLIIPSIAYEREIISSTNEYLDISKHLGINLPIVIFLTMLNIKGYFMATSNRIAGQRYTVDRNNLYLPEAYLEDYSVTADRILKDIFDSMWNACGYKRDLNYDEQGVWKPDR